MASSIYILMLNMMLVIKFVLFILLGFMVGTCGKDSIRFRPALIFQPKHANMFIDALDNILLSGIKK